MTRCRLGESPTLQSLPPLPEKGDNCISWVPMRSMWDKPPRDCVSPQGCGQPHGLRASPPLASPSRDRTMPGLSLAAPQAGQWAPRPR